MKVLVTGSSNGIGKATAELFLERGHEVIGVDMVGSTIDNELYTHYLADISIKEQLPEVEDVEILINNAGLQGSEDDIKNNLYGTINVTKKYGYQNSIKAILFNASASAHTGFEFPEYVASKAGMIGYMKHVASILAPKGAIVNSISCGGVLTDLNKPVMGDKNLWKQIMDVTPLKRWATAEEIAEWIYFMTVVNKFCVGQDVLIDGGEATLRNSFVWPEK